MGRRKRSFDCEAPDSLGNKTTHLDFQSFHPSIVLFSGSDAGWRRIGTLWQICSKFVGNILWEAIRIFSISKHCSQMWWTGKGHEDQHCPSSNRIQVSPLKRFTLNTPIDKKNTEYDSKRKNKNWRGKKNLEISIAEEKSNRKFSSMKSPLISIETHSHLLLCVSSHWICLLPSTRPLFKCF